ncbi:MAG: efflux RND transporter periplasmic adaptor subunit [Vicinamibacterales bacterium]
MQDTDPEGLRTIRLLGLAADQQGDLIADATDIAPAGWAEPPGHRALSRRQGSEISAGEYAGLAAMLLAVAVGTVIALLMGRRFFFPEAFAAAQAVEDLGGTIFTGTILPATLVTVPAPASGNVLKVLVRVGDTVALNDGLVVLDTPQARAALEQALYDQRLSTQRLGELRATAAALDRLVSARRLEATAASATVGQAQRDFEQVPVRQWRDSPERAGVLLEQATRAVARTRVLVEAGVLARATLDDAEVAARVAEDDLQRAQASASTGLRLQQAQSEASRVQADLARVESQERRRQLQDQIEQARLELEGAVARVTSNQRQIEAAVVKAARDGVVSDLPVTLGDHVAAGAPVARMTSLNQLLVEVEVAARLVNALKPSQPVTIALPTSPVQRLTAAIQSISPVPSAQMTHLVRINFINPTGMLLNGQPAQVVFRAQ